MTDRNIELYAQVVAGYITGISVINSLSGNYHIDFGVINELFKLNLPEDKDMLDHILNALNNDIVADVDAVDDFDIMLYTAFCPYLEDEED